MPINEYLQSPLNYTGGKYKLLSQILPRFPKKINTFIDLFCGGGNVGANVDCQRVIFNDISKEVIYLLQTFKNVDRESIFSWINQIISEYGLSDVSKYGYKYYKCDSAIGLGSYNKKNFVRLRSDFNQTKVLDYHYYITLFVLIIFSFNNQIRFNSKKEFNLPVGKRDFNKSMQKKLSLFIDRLHELNSSFSCVDFNLMCTDNFTENDFVYADPPYLITCASYNEQGRWNEKKEIELLSFLDKLNERNIRFALSNVLENKGKVNTILKAWLTENSNYKCHYLDYNYSNSNYHCKNRDLHCQEVLITNY